jgi:hypothetical protein
MPRQNGCVRCDSSAKLSCPTGCPDGTECGYELLLDCQSCPKAVCVASSDASSSDTTTTTETKSSGPNVGAIAGGVVAGVVLIAIATYLLWRFCIKPRRALETPQVYVEDVDRGTMGEKDLASRRDKRSSMHTVHSVASTVLTRASNIIQIAYIPGVTNRAPPPSPAVLVPPVPPIPVNFAQGGGLSASGSSPSSPYEDQHFFLPGNLRDSSYSGYSGCSDRTSYAGGTSYAPRSSIASTIYGKNVTIQAPQTGMRAKPTVVSVNVRSADGSSSSVGGATPPVPNIDFDKFGRPSSGVSTFSVGSTFISNATTAQPRAQVYKAGEVKKVQTPRQPATERLAPISASATPLVGSSLRSALSPPSSPEQQDGRRGEGPFSDPVDADDASAKLGAEIESATRRAAKVRSIRSSAIRETSPFGDEHATKEQ